MEESGSRELTGGQLYRVAWVFYLVLACFGVVWIGWREGTIGLGVFVEPGTVVADAGVGLAAGALLVGVWELLRRFVEAARLLEDRLAELLGPLDASEAAGLAVLSGVAEELFFRGAVQGSWGWVVACVLFAVLHLGPPGTRGVWTLFAGGAGVVFAGLMIWRGNLLAPMVAHALVNAVNLRRLAQRSD